MKIRRLLWGGVGWHALRRAHDRFAAMQLEYPTESHRADREPTNAFGQTAMTRSRR